MTRRDLKGAMYSVASNFLILMSRFNNTFAEADCDISSDILNQYVIRMFRTL